jgi:hypothetical protein
MNVLPTRLDIPHEKPVLKWIKEIWDVLMDINQYECTQQDKIRQWWHIPPEIPLFESYLVVENFPGIKKSKKDKASLSGEPGLEFEYIAQMEYPLRVELQPGLVLGLTMQYYPRYFTDAAIKTMLGDFHQLIDEILKNPHRTAGELRELIST